MTGLLRMVHIIDLSGNGKGADLSLVRSSLPRKKRSGTSTGGTVPTVPPVIPPTPGLYYYAPIIGRGF